MSSKGEMILWLSDARGIFIPRDFANSFADRAKHVTGVEPETWSILEKGPDPENEWYWEAWTDVEQNAVITDENGVKYTVWQCGDCWLVPKGMEWDEEDETYKWPEEVL